LSASRRTVDDLVAIDHANRKAGQVVFTFAVETGHLSCFATDQGTTGLPAALCYTFNDLGSFFRSQHACSQVVEEEKRFSALNDDVVNAHGDQVNADSVVTIKFERQLQLGADSVCRGNQNRGLVFILVQGKETAEATDVGENFGAVGRLDQGLDDVDKTITGFDIYAGAFIGHTGTIRQGCSPYI